MKNNFKSIVENHREKVRNTCFNFVRNIEDADDLSQEVFIQVYDSLENFREESQISTWIYRIAVNKSIDFLRRKKRKKRFAQLTSIFGFGDDEEINIKTDSNPLKELEMKEREKILYSNIDKLPDNQKAALILSKIEGFNNKEIAQIMNLSLSAVESLIHRAKKNLHKYLHDFYKNHL